MSSYDIAEMTLALALFNMVFCGIYIHAFLHFMQKFKMATKNGIICTCTQKPVFK